MASSTLTFDDEFSSLALHRTWQAGDKWQLIAPDSTDGRGGPNWGEGGSQWWVNPYNPSTPANGIYSVSNGMLNLSLLATPASEQAYIDQQAGTHLPYVGGLLNNSPADYQKYGLWETRMAVDRVPGFSTEIAIENVQLTGHWPPQLNIGVSTDANGNQTLQAHMYYNNTSSDYSQAIDSTQQHTYGVDWEADAITFYFDKNPVMKVANPGGVYQTDQMFTYLYTGANYSAGTGTNPPVASLPASAHIDYFRVYAGNPAPASSSFSIAPANVSHPEGNAGTTPFTFTVTRSGSTAGAGSVAWTVSGSGSNPANAADFARGVLPSGTVSFAAGQSQKTITVNVAGDRTAEPNEGFTVTLSKPSSGLSIGTATATGTIVNDDGTVRNGATASIVSASSVAATSDQMQFIAPADASNTNSAANGEPGAAGTDAVGSFNGAATATDLLPATIGLRMPVDHSAGAPILGINFGTHHSTGNFGVIEALLHQGT
jgi:beta-glucanase (GH16 family)